MVQSLNTAWQELAKEIWEDGLVCDIYISNPTIEDYRRFFAFLKAGNYSYTFGDPGQFSPDLPDETFFDDEERTITIGVADIVLNGWANSLREIELWVNPDHVKTKAQIEAYFNFMAELGLSMDKQVNLRIEGSKWPSITFSPANRSFYNGRKVLLER